MRIIKLEIKEDFEGRVMFNQFFSHVSLPHSFAFYFVTSIPKVDFPLHLGEFCLISRLGSL